MQNMPKSATYAAGNTASMQAAESVQHQLDGIRAEVFELIVSRGTSGITNSEIADALDTSRDTTQPRTSELKDAGYILDSGMLRKNIKGRNETVWVAAQNWPKGAWKKPSARSTQESGSNDSPLSDLRRTLQSALDHGIPAQGASDREWLSCFMSMERIVRSALRQTDQIIKGEKQ